MLWKKIKKKHLQFHQILKKIDTSSISSGGKKSFSIDKKKPFRPNKQFKKQSISPNISLNQDN